MIFVDCDDTLVLYPGTQTPNPYGALRDTPWEPNIKLIDALADIPGEQLCVWTGGGVEYAETWRQRLLPHAKFNAAKSLHLPKAGDLCIDDQPLKTACRVLTWEEFVDGTVKP